MATMVYVRATRPAVEGGPWRVQVGDAGHPPVLLRSPDGGSGRWTAEPAC